MTAEEILLALVVARVDVVSQAGNLRFRAPMGVLTDELRARIAEHRPALMALVQRGAVLPWRVVDWPEDARGSYEERAAIREFDGGATREDAERDAERDVRVDHARRSLGRGASGGPS